MLFVEDWIDDFAVRMTAVEDGWQAYHEYCITEEKLTTGKDYWCKAVSCQDIPFAVIALSLDDGVHSILEFLVDPKKCGRRLGTALLQELLSSGEAIIGHRIE